MGEEGCGQAHEFRKSVQSGEVVLAGLGSESKRLWAIEFLAGWWGRTCHYWNEGFWAGMCVEWWVVLG